MRARVEEGRDAALQALEEERFDIVLMDCQMPGMDGLQATQELREREARAGLPPTTVIALTADASEQDRQSCLAAGMDGPHAKPDDADELERTLLAWSARVAARV